ncbi:pleckstrin homology domain-containing family O member 1-A [Osmerus eperlanus]|uniref:pleckstrin homology domain-containing family O member 1-A n=1 Tax=Osmerus eperlanus TaxID=29151 RepID=UPI002E1289D0
MKKSTLAKRGPQDVSQLSSQTDKVGWIRKFCGKGIFREIWKNRFVILRGDHLYISEKEVKDERKVQEVFDLADYERSEELRKAKSRSKKNHSRFTLLRCRQPGNTAPNLMFLAVSPEEKESWVNALNLAIVKAKNRILDEVIIQEESVLVHPTRDRAKIPHGRRLPTRGHLLAVASTSSDGMLTLDLVHEEDGFYQEDIEAGFWGRGYRVDQDRHRTKGRQRAGTDVSKLRVTSREPRVKTGSLPRGSELSWGRHGTNHLDGHPQNQAQAHPQARPQPQAQSRTPQPGKRMSIQGRSRCASMDEVLSSRPVRSRSDLRPHPREEGVQAGPVAQAEGPPVGQLQSLIAQKMQRAQELLEEMRLQELQRARGGGDSAYLKGIDSPRLHHLRGSDSPRSRSSGSSPRSRSSDSPRLRGKDSPRLRGKDSPRVKGKRSRSKATDSPHSKGGDSPVLKGSDSPRLRGSDSPRLGSFDLSRPGESDSGQRAPDSPQAGEDTESSARRSEDSPGMKGTDSPCLRGSDSPRSNDSNSLPKGKESLGAAGKDLRAQDSPSLKGCDSPHAKRVDSLACKAPPPGGETYEVERRRAEAEQLLEEAVSSWKEAQEVLEEVKELQTQTLRRRRRRPSGETDATDTPPSPSRDEEEEDTP